MSSNNIFFAYQSASKSETVDVVDAIKNAVTNINKDNKFHARTWEDLRNNGRILVKAIFEAIEQCDIFSCDLTFLNHNVLFELGYAISKNKRLFILLNEKMPNAAKNFSKIDVLKNVGYSNFTNARDILKALDLIPERPQLLEDLTLNKSFAIKHDIFYISNASNSQSELDTYEFLSKSNYQVVFDSSDEVEYRPFAKYLEYISSANNVVVHITNKYVSTSFEENAKAALLAGYSCGMSKNVLLLAPQPYEAPIDYFDIMLQYENANDCTQKLEEWLKAYVNPISSQIVNNDVSDSDTELDLIKLGLDYDVAENERDKLDNYFVETKSYKYAQTKNRVFFVGRKGTGKTAIYIMLDNDLKNDPNNYVIALKPESSELLENVEVSYLYSSVAQKQSFFESIWKFVIYSKLLIEISERLKTKPKYYDDSSIENKINNYVDNNMTLLSKHFLELMRYVADNSRKDGNMLQNIYADYINPMKEMLDLYFKNTKYYRIAIIADNLDKSWDIKNGLSDQASMLLSLFEVTGHMENDLKGRNAIRVETKVILFLRKDIFEFILKEAREPDKLILNKQEIDWTFFPDQLKKLIEKRFTYVLDIPDNQSVSVWSRYFNLKLTGGATVFSRIQDVCLPRPRDLLMFMRHLFESAVNNGHPKVLESDFTYAVKEYAEFLYQNLIAEMVSEYPNIREILEYLHTHYVGKIEFKKLNTELATFINNTNTVENLIDTLISNGYFKITNEKTGEVYSKCSTAQSVYQNTFKRFLWFVIKPRKKVIYVVLTPQYSRMRRTLS